MLGRVVPSAGCSKLTGTSSSLVCDWNGGARSVGLRGLHGDMEPTGAKGVGWSFTSGLNGEAVGDKARFAYRGRQDS